MEVTLVLWLVGNAMMCCQIEMVDGVVTAIDEEGGTITIETEDGETLTVLVPDDFDFTGIEVSSNVKVRGVEQEDGSIDADWIHIVEEDSGDH